MRLESGTRYPNFTLRFQCELLKDNYSSILRFFQAKPSSLGFLHRILVRITRENTLKALTT